MTKALTHAESVTRARQAAGAKGTTLYLKPDERELLDRMAERWGGIKPAVLEGLRRLDGQGEPSDAQLLAMLERRLRG